MLKHRPCCFRGGGARQAECVMKLLQQLNVSKFSVIGTSYGGFVAYRIAHMYPHAVHKLVISSSAVNMTPETDEAMVKRFKTKDVTEILQPHDAEGVRRASILAFYRQPLFGIPTFMCNDLLDVSPSLTLVFFRQINEKKVRRLKCYHFIFKLV
jgi:pimeloyl-ACP methyl ester carboxylesterase